MNTDVSVYLDYNATAPAQPEVIKAMAETMALGATNPSSVHAPGREARRRIEKAREEVAALVDADAEQVIFTMGGTEANNLVLAGCGMPRILVSAVEHAAVLRVALMKSQNANVIPVSIDGVVDLDALDQLLGADETPALVSVMAANNETGVLQPIKEVVEISRSHDAKIHTDAAQAAGKVAIDFSGWNVDFMTLSAHKIGGPQGVGAVICRKRDDLRPIILGGGQEHGLRGVAARLAATELESSAHRMVILRDSMEKHLLDEVPHMKIIGAGAARLPNTSCMTMPGVRNDTQVMALDLAGVAVSAGSACSAGKVEPSHVLDAMGIGEDNAIATIRVSLGNSSTQPHVEKFIAAWLDLWKRKGNSRTAA